MVGQNPAPLVVRFSDGTVIEPTGTLVLGDLHEIWCWKTMYTYTRSNLKYIHTKKKRWDQIGFDAIPRWMIIRLNIYVYVYVMYVCMYGWMDGWMDVCDAMQCNAT